MNTIDEEHEPALAAIVPARRCQIFDEVRGTLAGLWCVRATDEQALGCGYSYPQRDHVRGRPLDQDADSVMWVVLHDEEGLIAPFCLVACTCSPGS